MYPLNSNPMYGNSQSNYGNPISSPMGFQNPQGSSGGQMNPSMSVMPNAFAKGGHLKRGKLIMAHFNPQELSVLDHLQGKREECPRSGMRSYSHLEELLKNPHILSALHHHTARHHAHGGHAQAFAEGGHVQGHYGSDSLNRMAHNGEHGDEELALIGPHTYGVLSRLAAPGTLRNHIDGRPQFWSLKGVLGGLWDTVKSGAQAAAPYIGSIGKAVLPYASSALQQAAGARFGPLGQAAAAGLSGLADKGLGSLSEMGSDAHRGMASTVGEGLGTALRDRQEGEGLGQTFGRGLAQAGSRFGGGVGGAMQGMGRSMQSGQGYRDVLKAGAQGGYQGAGGMDSIKNAAQGLMSQYSQGMSPRQMASGFGERALGNMRGSLPTRESMNNQDMFRELPFSSDYE